jgi:hypothetical protein
MTKLVYILLAAVQLSLAWGQTSSPTTGTPTTAISAPNTCLACSTAACVAYYHALSPTVQDIEIGASGVQAYNPSFSYLYQSINIGAFSSGVLTLGGQQTQVNIASGVGPTPVGPTPGTRSPTATVPTTGAVGTINLGANSVNPSAQSINIGATTTGTIKIGGTGSTVNIANGAATGTVTIGSSTSSAQTVNIAPTTSGTITIGGTGSAVNIANGAATGTVTIGSSTSSAQTVNIAPTTSGTITIGGTGSAVNIANGAATGTVTIGSSTSSAQTVNIAPTTSGTITIGGASSSISIAPAAASPATITLGAGASTSSISIGRNSVPAASQAITIGPATSGTITVGGSSSFVNIAPGVQAPASIGIGHVGATGAINIGASGPTPSPQPINIAPFSTGTIQIGGSGSTVAIGGTVAPATSATITLNKLYPNMYGLWKLNQAPTSPGTQPISTVSGQRYAIGWPKTTPTTTTVSTNLYPVPSPAKVQVIACPPSITQSNNPPSPVTWNTANNNDCINFQTPGIYRVCVNDMNIAPAISGLYLARVSCNQDSPTPSYVVTACTPTPAPAPATCLAGPIASPIPAPVTSLSFSSTTAGMQATTPTVQGCTSIFHQMYPASTSSVTACTTITVPDKANSPAPQAAPISNPVAGPNYASRAPVIYAIFIDGAGSAPTPTVFTIQQNNPSSSYLTETSGVSVEMLAGI